MQISTFDQPILGHSEAAQLTQNGSSTLETSALPGEHRAGVLSAHIIPPRCQPFSLGLGRKWHVVYPLSTNHLSLMSSAKMLRMKPKSLGLWFHPALRHQRFLRGSTEKVGSSERRRLTEWVCACSFPLGGAVKATCNKQEHKTLEWPGPRELVELLYLGPCPL